MIPPKKSIETLSTQVDEVKTDLDAVTKETSQELKKTKEQMASEKAKATKLEITQKLDTLKGLTDDKSKADAVRLEAMLKTLDSLAVLKTSVQVDNTAVANVVPPVVEDASKTAENKEEKPEEKKNRLKRQRDWFSDSTEENHGWKNAARIAWGIGVGVLAWKWLKKLFGIGKNKESSSSNSEHKEWSTSWRKWLVGWGLLAAGGYGIFKLLKSREWLSFDDALVQVQAELANISEADDMSLRGGTISYEESVKQIKSYEVWTKIEKWDWITAKKIEWLDIKFSDNKQLIHAANLINYIKHKYKGRCLDTGPFHAGKITGDVYVDIKDWNGTTKEEEVISGGMLSTLSSICPDLLNGIVTDTNNKDKFLAYLNKQGIWKEGNVWPDFTVKWDKINEEMKKIRQEVIDTPSEFNTLWEERGKVLVVPWNTDKTEYTVESRRNVLPKTKIKVEVDATGNIISGKIDGLDTTFKDTKELLRTANLVNKLKYQYTIATPLHLKKPTDEAFYRTSSYWLVGWLWWYAGIFADSSDIISLPPKVDTWVVKKETLELEFPTVLANKEKFVSYLNGLKRPDGKWFRQKWS